jgi:hypothetical protein
MQHKAIIAQAWRITQEYKSKFFIFGFILGFITLTFEALWMVWQYYSFSNAPNLTGQNLRFREIFQYASNIITNYGTLAQVLIIAIIVFIILYFLAIPVLQGGLIVLIKRANDGLEVKKRHGISEGILNFFRLFAFHNLVAFVFSPLSIFTYITTPLKFVSWEAFYFVLIPGSLWLITALVANVLFVYVKFFLVLRQMHVGEAIRHSARFVVRYFAETFVVFLLLLIIALRVILNIVLVFVVPLVVTSVLVFFINALIGYQTIIMIVLGIIMLFVASWIYGNFLVFTQAVWEFAFIELEKKDRIFEEEQSAESS